MRYEIQKHWKKLKSISKLSDEQLSDSRDRLFARIHFINESLIPAQTWSKAKNYTFDIDIDDTDFVALTIHLKGHLWTGDKELYNGLKEKGFTKIFNTEDLKLYRSQHSSL